MDFIYKFYIFLHHVNLVRPSSFLIFIPLHPSLFKCDLKPLGQYIALGDTRTPSSKKYRNDVIKKHFRDACGIKIPSNLIVYS